jgi:Transposase
MGTVPNLSNSHLGNLTVRQKPGPELWNHFDVMISSGQMEGTNNKIKTMKRQAHRFRDREFFKLKILAIHETRYELIGS